MTLKRTVKEVYDDETNSLIGTEVKITGTIDVDAVGGDTIELSIGGVTKISKTVPVGKTVKGKISINVVMV